MPGIKQRHHFCYKIAVLIHPISTTIADPQNSSDGVKEVGRLSGGRCKKKNGVVVLLDLLKARRPIGGQWKRVAGHFPEVSIVELEDWAD